LITRSAINKGEVSEKDVLTIDSSGQLVEGVGKVSTEAKLHLNIYSKRKDVYSVIHVHPVYATAIAASLEEFPNNIFPEVILTLGKIPICEYKTPSTNALAESINPFVEYSNVFLLSNHGSVTVGESIEVAFNRLEKLEHISKTISVAKQFGNLKKLSKNEIKNLYSIAESTYGLKISDGNKVINEK
jgi:L-fuculose-phosphate aldolase